MGRIRLEAALLSLTLLTFLCAPAAARDRHIMIFPPQNFSPSPEQLPPVTPALGESFAALLAESLGRQAEIADAGAEEYPDDVTDRAAIERFALSRGADAVAGGFYLLERRGDGELFARMVLYASDLTDTENRFTRSYQGRLLPSEIEGALPTLAGRAAEELRARIPPLTDEGELRLAAEAEKAAVELRARRTVTVTVRGHADPEVRVILPDGSSPGTLATGELILEAAAESLFRLRLEKPGHYTRLIERYAAKKDLLIEVPYIYPQHSRDLGFSHSYLRPFGLLAEGRLRLLDETVTAGVSAGLFLLPEYGGSRNSEPDFSRLMVETELGFHLGWYLFSPPDAVLRLLLEVNTRLNSYTMTNEGGRTFLAAMTGPGLRLEANQLNWILHVGIRGYYPHLTPTNEQEMGIILVNGGLAWKF
jgi:hypothetical protein